VLQDKINAVIRVTLEFPVFPAIKEILKWQGIDCGPCILPRAGLTPEQAVDLRRKLEPCGL
jgi:N-acetylneuraminate lyase